MNEKELRRRQNDSRVKFINDHIVTKDNSEKNFLFVSYKSDDWEVVLGDVVYRLVKDYGLNVYFDESFDTHNDSWIKQLCKNMGASNCAGVLAFVDDKYTTSYATALELMYSQCNNGSRSAIPVIQVNIGKTTPQTGNIQNTGLGKKQYEDGTDNFDAEAEQERFDKCFIQLVKDKKIEKSRDRYDVTEGELIAYGCSEIVKEIIKNLSINRKLYDGEYKQEQDAVILTKKCSEDFLEKLKASIEDACKVKVFGNADTTKAKNDMETTRTIRETEATYKILTFGKELDVGSGVLVTVKMGGNTYECKTHSSVKGRIDGLSKLYKDNKINVGDMIKAKYSSADKTIYLECLKGANGDSETLDDKNNIVKAEHDMETVKTIGETEATYKILTLGSLFHIGFGAAVTVKMNGKSYKRKMHKSVKGRIDGLSDFYEDNEIKVDTKIKATYTAADTTVTIEKL